MENKRKILIVEIVEDDTPLRHALHDKFEREGFATLEAKNGKEGLRIALQDHPDLILLDLLMPKMDGMTMLRMLRENSWGKTVPVVILTNLTSDDEQRMRDITETEPTYYLVKTDWKIEDVVEKVREALDSPVK